MYSRTKTILPSMIRRQGLRQVSRLKLFLWRRETRVGPRAPTKNHSTESLPVSRRDSVHFQYPFQDRFRYRILDRFRYACHWFEITLKELDPAVARSSAATFFPGCPKFRCTAGLFSCPSSRCSITLGFCILSSVTEIVVLRPSPFELFQDGPGRRQTRVRV